MLVFLQAGDYVRVNSGQHEGQTGMIVSVEEPICVLMTDATREQLQVFTRDLAESSNVASGVDTCAAASLVSTAGNLVYRSAEGTALASVKTLPSAS